MKSGKKICCILFIGILLLMVGCGVMKVEMNIVNKKPLKQGVKLNLSGHKGTMKYELENAYATRDLKKHGIDIRKLDEYSSIDYMNDKGKIEHVSYPDYFENKEEGLLNHHTKLYICTIKVTNEGATSMYEKEYKNPYMFQADEIFLCYLPDKMSRTEQIKYKNVEYYSLRKDGDHEWSTYELKPGESITYDVGFILGENLDGKELDMKKGALYLANTGGSEDGEYYKIDWSEK